METEIAGAAGSHGSLAALSGAAKAFVLAHPIGMAATGGALLGLGTYYVLRKTFSKKPALVAA
jgi:hypothetical protein